MKLAPCTVPLFASLTLIAQSPDVVVPLPMRGMMPAFDAGMMFSNDGATIARKGRNLPVRPSTFTNLGTQQIPEFTVAQIELRLLAQAAMPQALPALEIDAISTGNDLLPLVYHPVTKTYRVSSGSTDGWAALLLTLEPEVGHPLYAGAPPSVDGATVFGYYFANPSFPGQLQKAIYHELLRSDFELGAPSLLPTANIDSLDVAMGLIHSNRGAIDPGVITSVDRLYFSVTRNCALALEQAQAVPNAGGLPLNGATIFVAHFDLTTQSVGLVDVHDRQLGLRDVEVDALGLAVVSAASTTQPGELPLPVGSTMFVFSAAAGHLPEELMAAAWPQGTSPSQKPLVGPLRTDQGTRLVGGGGVLHGRVKSLCAKDPEISHGAASFGVPTGSPTAGASFPNTMNLSIAASWTTSDPVTDGLTLSGVVTGYGQPADALPVLAFGMGDPNQFMLPTWFSFLLPVCPAGTLDYTFELPLQVPWLTSLMLPNLHDVFVVMVPLAGNGPIEATYTTLFRRTYTP